MKNKRDYLGGNRTIRSGKRHCRGFCVFFLDAHTPIDLSQFPESVGRPINEVL